VRSSSKPATSSTEKLLTTLKDAGFDEIPILDIDHVNTGAYVRNTLAVDKNASPAKRRCTTSTA
jgi:hypothetical protein